MKTPLHFLLLFTCLISYRAQATTYYVSANGNDKGAGTSVATAWQTIERVNTASLHAGDRVLFEGNRTFTGSIYLGSKIQGTKAQPIVISSYGKSRATIASGKSSGFYAYNVGGIELRSLNFEGSGRLSNTESGVSFYLDSVDTHFNHLVLDSLDVKGYRSSGISIGSWKGASGYDNVRVTNCTTHENGEAGFCSYSEALKAHRNWYFGTCKFYDNAGRAEVTYTHTGSGLVVAGLDGGIIEHCEAYNNGWLNANPGGGPVGIWAYCCNNLVIQECESHHNRSGTIDGGGFDLDGGCTNSIMQYNYSHDNDGGGYLLCQYDGAPEFSDVTVRYNISENDARKQGQGAIMLWSTGASGGIRRASIHNNTVFITPSADGSKPKAVAIISGGISDVAVTNNILQTTDGLSVVSSQTTQGVRFQGNCYWGTDQALTLQWGGSTFNSLTEWRTASGQEYVGGHAVGFNIDPKFTAPGSGGTLNRSPNSALAAYVLQPTSALIGAALDLNALFSYSPGPRDFYGTPTPQVGLTGNVGAYESNRVVQAAHNSSTTPTIWCSAYPNPVQDALHITTNTPASGSITVRLYDGLGRLCRTHTGRSNDLLIPVRDLQAGNYFLQVESGAQRFGQKVIIGSSL
ncbi:T9SS type A sorting domain-containing protein [Hymenobacter sp. BT491]|uniref:T9SS type A sorting domain-containing protein n=1 Tax=Hymenobacter sp. BT491 TaxID=2766779 RepID=UPI00165385E9|nr:T9SS type A sorting domain-containing protein [Hymenobacter sp. BT491]MBC6990097.1 T9SS type A sorting domain-containing protein [Hymenobacter sp. BT491]